MASSYDQSVKYDAGKDRWSLLPMASIRQVVKVLTYGAAKYQDEGWRKVEPARYLDALYRHLYEWGMGRTHDEESGLPHLAHALCNLVFLFELTGGDE